MPIWKLMLGSAAILIVLASGACAADLVEKLLKDEYAEPETRIVLG